MPSEPLGPPGVHGTWPGEGPLLAPPPRRSGLQSDEKAARREGETNNRTSRSNERNHGCTYAGVLKERTCTRVPGSKVGTSTDSQSTYPPLHLLVQSRRWRAYPGGIAERSDLQQKRHKGQQSARHDAIRGRALVLVHIWLSEYTCCFSEALRSPKKIHVHLHTPPPLRRTQTPHTPSSPPPPRFPLTGAHLPCHPAPTLFSLFPHPPRLSYSTHTPPPTHNLHAICLYLR